MNENLVSLLYLIMRDEIPTGIVAAKVKEIEECLSRKNVPILTNKHLEAYARELIKRLEVSWQ